MGQKYLITGGAGFIGSNYLNLFVLKNKDDFFICLDSLTYAGDILYINKLLSCDNFKFVKGDIRDCNQVFSLFESEKIDIVINFAAETHVDNSIVNGDLFFDTNVFGTKVLLDACLKYGVKRFHQISTDEVYGNNVYNTKFKETSLLNPSSPYSASKAAADLLVLSYYKTYGLPVTISRSCNNYGLNQHKEKLIPNIVDKIKNNNTISIYGDGENKREWIYVLDHCHAVDAIIKYGKVGEIYNIGSSVEFSNNEIVAKILSLFNCDRKLIKYVVDRKGHDFRYGIDTTKIFVECKWKPIYSFEEAFYSTINHLKSSK